MTTAAAKQNAITHWDPAPREYQWAADEFDRACDMGVFGCEARLELIHGRVIDRIGQGPLHSSLAAYFADCLRAALSPRFTVREGRAIRIALDGEPVPDITVVSGGQLDYREQHPTPEDVILLVEIAVSSEGYDLGGKDLLYAQAGIADYWVVLPERGEFWVHRGPTPEGYASVVPLDAEAVLSPLAASDVSLPVRDLLGASG